MSCTCYPPSSSQECFFTVGFGFRLTQQIHFVPPPEPVLTSSPSLLSTDLPSSNSGETPGLPADSSWPHQKFPRVVVRGVIFRRLQVDVECKVSLKHRIWLSWLTLVSISAYCTRKQCTSYACFWCLRLPSIIIGFTPSERRHPTPPCHDMRIPRSTRPARRISCN